MALRLRWTLCALLITLVVLVLADKVHDATSGTLYGRLSALDIEDRLQECPVMEKLNYEKANMKRGELSRTERIFAKLFPSTPAINSLLATMYISGPPNLLLILCPPNIDPASLQVMVSFAVGGLMGDTLFHLLPEIFLGEASPDHVSVRVVEPNKNLVLGAFILVGFLTFLALDKLLRIATIDDETEGSSGGHSHSHAIKAPEKEKKEQAYVTSRTVIIDPSAARNRKPGTPAPPPPAALPAEPEQEIKLGGYLNLIADFTHNITDGLAMATSFYASPTLGATTAMAVFFHEIPHEVGDFALLIQSGFTKGQAMSAQFITAIGAFMGTMIGILIHEYGLSSCGTPGGIRPPGLFGTSLVAGDLLLPFTAGTFLYVGTVAVIPDLLVTGKDYNKEIRNTITQFVAIGVGAGIMLYISWDS